MLLRELAHSRAGDKGGISQISVIARQQSDFNVLRCNVTVERVRKHFGHIVRGAVQRYELPHLGILNFVLHDALSSGVTRSLALDPHGKCLSSVMLDLELGMPGDASEG
ncbi:hypothetical protein XW59_011530 [Aquamicrobium sp. LC103]|nr:hypothetical protein [Aquamicrobium sp. LC103]TKT78453.1 hypothetical protein XW59_011530 [Aquamicrobium sp. LC103]